jgi:glycosyltransferase involved in cell wall biosynthesis
MTAPRVSVVMSVYNGERHLGSAIDSILQQSFSDFEFIIVNDGSTDGSTEILREFESRDSRVRVIDQTNCGLTIALQTGCAAAHGEFIARQDADDWSDPTRLEKLINLFDLQTDAAMVGSWAAYIDDDGELVELIERCANSREATHRLLYEKYGPPAHGTVMFRRSVYEQVGGYRTCFYFGQDSDLWLRLGIIGQIGYVQESLYRARISANGISGKHAHWQSQFGKLGQQCHSARLQGQSEQPFIARAEQLRQAFLSQRSNRSSTTRQEAAAHYRIGTSLSRRGNPRARKHFWSAICLNPLHVRSWCRWGATFLLRAGSSQKGSGRQVTS